MPPDDIQLEKDRDVCSQGNTGMFLPENKIQMISCFILILLYFRRTPQGRSLGPIKHEKMYGSCTYQDSSYI